MRNRAVCGKRCWIRKAISTASFFGAAVGGDCGGRSGGGVELALQAATKSRACVRASVRRLPLSNHLSLFPCISVFISLPLSLRLCLTEYQHFSVYLSLSAFLFLSRCLSVHLSLFVCLSLSVSVFLSLLCPFSHTQREAAKHQAYPRPTNLNLTSASSAGGTGGVRPSLLAAAAFAWRTRTASRRTDSTSAVANDKLSLSRDIPEPIPDGRLLNPDPLKKLT